MFTSGPSQANVPGEVMFLCKGTSDPSHGKSGGLAPQEDAHTKVYTSK
jgi:hypothetical protein